LNSLIQHARKGAAILGQGPHSSHAAQDAEFLLAHLIGRNRAWFLAHLDDEIPLDQADLYGKLIHRRLAGEPIQYITGETEFYGLTFRVTPAVLIPRPETEHLVEEVLKRAAQIAHPRITPLRVLDIGTGSGCIAIALAHHLPQATITAIDLSPEAINLARQNAALNNFADRIRFLQGDLLAPVASEAFDLIVSNPPYVPTTDRPTLSVEVRDHEPAVALFAGPDGLDLYRRLIPASHAAIVPGGLLLLEISYGQQPAVTSLLEASGFHSIDVFPDLQGIPRVLCTTRAHT